MEHARECFSALSLAFLCSNCFSVWNQAFPWQRLPTATGCAAGRESRMGWEGSKRVFLQFLTLCACVRAGQEHWGITEAWILPREENRHQTLESHQGTIHTQFLSQNQLFPTSISPLTSNAPGSSPVGWSQLPRVHAAGGLPKNPTRLLPGQHRLGALRYRCVCASLSP